MKKFMHDVNEAWLTISKEKFKGIFPQCFSIYFLAAHHV